MNESEEEAAKAALLRRETIIATMQTWAAKTVEEVIVHGYVRRSTVRKLREANREYRKEMG